VTIDDLPTTGALPPDTTRVSIVDRMVEILRRHAVPAVYGFTNAGQLRDNPAFESILLAWRKGGFPLGNHTLSHLDLDRVSTGEFVADIERNEALLEPLAPPGAAKFFRYPYLHLGNDPEKRAAVRSWLASRGYRIAPVTVYVEHWEWSNAYTRCVAQKDAPAIRWVKETYLEASKARLAWAREISAQLFKRQMKHVLLLHADAIDAAILDDLLSAHQAAGVTLISLESALQDPAYGTYVDEPGDGDHTFLAQAARAQGVDIPSLRAGAPPAVDRTCR
jgi:peptidoglycan/xylan/chitin deacetylase (PgdA/CDA1 family)